MLKRLACISVLMMTVGANAQEMSTSADVRDCRDSLNTTMPLIAWGPDGVVIDANGGDFRPGGDLERIGWELSLEVVDDFSTQLESYITCESPFLRGTLGMLLSAAPVTEADPRTEQVIIYQHSWSIGDGIVGGPSVENVSDLVGKRVALQQFGPHVAFLGRILSDAGYSLDDVEIVWTSDLTGDGDTPLDALSDGRADAAAMILPDARIASSGGRVGTGAEGSIEGARIIFSTLEAASVIGDYISVRKDFFENNRDDISQLVNALFIAEERVREYMADDGNPSQISLATIMANEMLGGLPMEEGIFLWRDAISQGWSGNAEHFSNPNHPRRFSVLLEEVSLALAAADVLQRPYRLLDAEWDYSALAVGLKDISERQVASFDTQRASQAVDRLRATGQIDNETRISTRIFFEPSVPDFPVQFYRDDFDEILRLASIYSGALIAIEGHVDPIEFRRAEQNGATARDLQFIRTDAENLSLRRANAVLEALIEYAKENGIMVNETQFVTDGLAFDEAIFDPPTTEEEWRQNMRVVFRVLQSQSEATTFSPLQ